MAGTHEPVAVLGIGAMGHGMAASALRAGIPVIVWNRTMEATRDLAELGAQVADTAAAAARRAAIVVTMVTDADAVISIARDQGMLAALAPGTIWVQMSTIGVAGINRVAAMVSGERPDVMLLDAPVSGSRDPAERGELVIFASGSGEARSRVEPLFGALGQRTIWVGEVGAATRLKLVNNTWLAFATEAVAASAALARLLGLEAGTVVDALGGGPLVSPWQAAKLQRVASGEFSAQFALSLALKDVHLALQAAGDGRAPRPRLPGRRMAAGRGPRAWRAGPDRRHAHDRTAGRNALTLFFQQFGVREAPAKVTPIGTAAVDLSPGPEVGPPHPRLDHPSPEGERRRRITWRPTSWSGRTFASQGPAPSPRSQQR